MIDNRGKQIYNLSLRSLGLAQAVDMLPPGVYQVTIEKPELSSLPWDINISRVEVIQILRLNKRNDQLTDF